MKTKRLIAFALAAVSGVAWAQQQGPFQPGEYLDRYGGYLIVKPGSGGGNAFTLHTTGQNKSVCNAQGVIQKNRQAVLKDDGAKACTLYFEQKSDGIEVDLKEICNAFCGVGATLDGMFRRAEAGCERAGVRKARGDFKRLYDKKSFADARATLEPVLARCMKSMDVDTEGWIRNDLAVTYYHLGDTAACRKTLAPYAEDAAKTEAQLRQELPRADQDTAIRLARATRTNLKLCAK